MRGMTWQRASTRLLFEPRLLMQTSREKSMCLMPSAVAMSNAALSTPESRSYSIMADY
jgi:hypothetical protein